MAIDLERRSTADKGYSDSLYEVHFVPVTERTEYQEGPVANALKKLQEKMEKKDFETYINSLLRINYDGKRLLLITRREINRTMLEGKFRKDIADAFETQQIRVVSQA
ncbi:hypothetical protein HMPREF1633_00290 [Tissierellia bacterium S5-A11]|nr:hypothetical protein HMPREF1633_00290 [Tissierellia bacterium S5-A11]